MTRFRVVVTATAENQIRSTQRWWIRERPAAPDLFLKELEQALERLAEMPRSGAAYLATDPLTVRRVLLGRSRFHAYYSVDDDSQRVVVRAIWHSARGHGPDFS